MNLKLDKVGPEEEAGPFDAREGAGAAGTARPGPGRGPGGPPVAGGRGRRRVRGGRAALAAWPGLAAPRLAWLALLRGAATRWPCRAGAARRQSDADLRARATRRDATATCERRAGGGGNGACCEDCTATALTASDCLTHHKRKDRSEAAGGGHIPAPARGTPVTGPAMAGAPQRLRAGHVRSTGKAVSIHHLVGNVGYANELPHVFQAK
ncbi:Protein of unknown function [Gryllus bimaculatus]|nr:Protein of unknown function [Gryllus bimaculatus]